jgi:hypothetical protein
LIKKVNLAQTESFLIENILKSGRDADAGNCVVVASLLFLISAAVHGVIHPEVGVSAAIVSAGLLTSKNTPAVSNQS